MIRGLRLPHLSDPDPELAGEGNLDPLGFFPIADRLADQIAPGITARMRRVRFVTAIAVATVVTERLSDILPRDGVTPPYLAFEWLLAEAFARGRGLPPEATRGAPGSEKARRAVARGDHLDARSYLKVAKVFGYHGVYWRLAESLGVVGKNRVLLRRGEELLHAWELEQNIPGFVDREVSSRGGQFARKAEEAVRRALVAGSVTEDHTPWNRLTESLRLDRAGARERSLLRQWLLDASEPVRREFICQIEHLVWPDEPSEMTILRAIRKRTSPELRIRLVAVSAFEKVAGFLQGSFDHLRRVSTTQGTKPVRLSDLGKQPFLARASREVAAAVHAAVEALEPLDLGGLFEQQFEQFEAVSDVRGLVETVLERHRRVQAAKPPGGKRPWFEETGDGLIVRVFYRLDEEPEPLAHYLHPYRVRALHDFLEDLK